MLADDMRNNVETRIPLLPIQELIQGQNNCTGGGIFYGHLPTGSSPKITGMFVNDPSNQLMGNFLQPRLNQNITNQPLASNIGKVLFEMREVGIRQTSNSNISDSHIFSFIHGVRAEQGLTPTSVSTEITITDKLINGLGRTA